MSLVIRFSRIGRKGEAKYRLVVKEKRSKRDGAAIDTIGFFEKRVSGENVKNIDRAKLDLWVSRGAILSDSAKRALA